MLYGLLTGRLEYALSQIDEGKITEIRLRRGRPLVVVEGEKRIHPITDTGRYIVTADDIEKVLGFATDFSIYAVNDQLTKGYLVKNGVRIGVSGFGVVEQGKIITIKDINALVLRVPHEVKGCAESLLPKMYCDGRLKSTLIISPPGAGKTTMLRDMARLVSATENVLIIDERFELAGLDCGFDIGESEVMSGVEKKIAYEFGIRSMSPTLIVTDEIFSEADAGSIEDIVRCGVKVFASIHGESLKSLKENRAFHRLLSSFEVYVTLAPVGKVVSVEYQ